MAVKPNIKNANALTEIYIKEKFGDSVYDAVKIVASNIADITAVAQGLNWVTTAGEEIDEIKTVNQNITEVITVSQNIADLVSVADTIIPNLSEILDAYPNALIAQQAAETAQSEAESARDAAATSEANAAASASAASDSADQTAADVLLTNADVIATNADVITTNANAQATANDVVATNADAAQTALDAQATAGDRVQTGLDAAATAQDVIDAQAAKDTAISARDAAQTSESNAAGYESSIQIMLASFSGLYYGAYATPPVEDPYGNPIETGDLYFDTSSNRMMTWSGSAWVSGIYSGPINVDVSAPDDSLVINASGQITVGQLTASTFIGDLTGNADTATNATDHIANTSNPHNVTPSQIGLGSVENTSLSTWIGSENITTLGTIITGIWQGASIADAYIASATQWNAAYTHSNVTGNPHGTTIANIFGLQTALDGKVDDSQVLTDVPAGALFTDTIYTHPAEHPISKISGLQTALDAKVAISDIVDNLTSLYTDQPLSANQGKVLKGYIDDINALLNTDDTTLDELQEIVDYIKLNRADLDSLSISSIAGLQSALDDKVDDNQVLTNVPADAVFTDTVYSHQTYTARSINTAGASILDTFTSDEEGHVTGITTRILTLVDLGYTGATNANYYTHPANHSPSIITQDANNRFVTDTQINNWGTAYSHSGTTGNPHSTAIADISGLQTALDGKSDDAHNHDTRYYGDVYGGVSTVKSASEVGYTTTSLSGRFNHLRGGLGVASVTFAEALADAFSKGVRLPTVDELEDEIVKGTGGGFDSEICWTCSPVPGRPGYVYAKLGTGAGTRYEYATNGTQTAYTRYVANVNVPNFDHRYYTESEVDSLLSGKVDDSQVLTNVPVNAVFTDTVYTHPAYTSRSVNTSGASILDTFTSDAQGHVTGITTRTLTLADLGFTGDSNANYFTYSHPTNHPPSIISQDASNRFVTDTEKATWNAKADAHSHPYLPTAGGTVTGATTFSGGITAQSVAINIADALSFENGKHWITYNDGTGNFNIRIGNKDSGGEVCTENGYCSHMEWSQSGGWLQWNWSGSLSAGNSVSWLQTMTWNKDGVLTVPTLAATTINASGNVTWSGGNSTQANTAYTHSQSAHAPSDANNYSHPPYTSRSINSSGASVLDTFTSDSQGHVTGISTRTLTLADLGYTGASNANYYVHPTYNGDDFSVDSGALGGATVISDIDINVTTDSYGHVTDCNGAISTRNLTPANIGAAPASHSHSYLPLSGGTLTGQLTCNSEIEFTNYGIGIVGKYDSYKYRAVYSMGDAYKLATDGSSPGNLYGIAFVHTNVGGQSKSGLGHQALIMANGVTQTALGSGIWTNGVVTWNGGNSSQANTAYAHINLTSAHSATSANTANRIVMRDASGNFSAGIITATATAARYSDLAEKYTIEGEWEPGNIVSRNREEGAELKITNQSDCPDVFGVISTNPAFLMNQDSTGAPIVMIGRAPIKIIGPVKKWDLIVPAGNGCGRAIRCGEDFSHVIGEALAANIHETPKYVECFINIKARG